MAFALVRSTADGNNTPITLGFSYRDTGDIVVKVDGVTKTLTTHYTFPTSNTITFTAGNIPTNGQVVEVRRATNHSARLVDYVAGATLTETDLDTDSEQAFFMAQESLDTANDSITLNASDVYEGNSKRIINIADPTGAQDVATKAYTDSQVSSVATNASAAATSASAAATSATNSAASATSAASSATSASTDGAAQVTLATAQVALATTQATNAAASATAAAASAASANVTVASQAEAEAGTDNSNVMTALRTKQAVDSYGVVTADDVATTGANKILKLDGSGHLPALNGSNLTNLSVTDVSADVRFLALQVASDRIGLEDGIADPFTDETDVSLYVQTDGTTIGDLHSSNHGGIEAVFNGTTDAAAASSGSKASASNFYVGKQFASAEVVTGFSITGSNNVGFYSPNDTATITATLYGKNGTPTSGTDGTVIGSAQSGTDANSLTLSESGNGNTTAYTHVWVYVSHGDSADSMYCTDLRYTLADASEGASHNSTGTFYSGESQATVAQGTGTAIGNMTAGGGLAAAFDGSINAAYGATQRNATSGIIGKDWGSGVTKKITGISFTTPSNVKIDGGAGAETITITVERSANNTDWTQIYSESGLSNNANSQVFTKITGFSNTAAARYVRINFSHSGGAECHIAEVVFYEATVANMTLVIGVQVVENEAITINTDLTAEVSRDGGSNFTSCTLVLKSTLGATSTKYYESASTDISGQPSGTAIKYRIKTLNTKNIEAHGVALRWS